MSDSDSDDFDAGELQAVADLRQQQAADDSDNDDAAAAPTYVSGHPSGAINNKYGLEKKTKELLLPEGVSWVEGLMLTSPQPLNVDNVNDDLKREAEFYA
jgi:hypothetical protein